MSPPEELIPASATRDLRLQPQDLLRQENLLLPLPQSASSERDSQLACASSCLAYPGARSYVRLAHHSLLQLASCCHPGSLNSYFPIDFASVSFGLFVFVCIYFDFVIVVFDRVLLLSSGWPGPPRDSPASVSKCWIMIKLCGIILDI